MSDVGINRNWLVSPTKEVEDMWLDVQIQEKRSRIARHKQDIEDLQKGKLVELSALIKMLEREIKELTIKRTTTVTLTNEES